VTIVSYTRETIAPPPYASRHPKGRKMLKRALACSALLAAGLVAFAQEAPQQSGPLLSGQFSFGLGDFNALDEPLYESVPGVSADNDAGLLEIRLSSTLSRQPTDSTLYKGLLRTERRFGIDAGLSLDMTDLLSISEATYKDSFDADDSNYSLIQPMIDWYANNRARYGLSRYPYSFNAAGNWPKTSYGAETGRYQFIHGSTVEPSAWVKWTEEKWADARALYMDIRYAIEAEIESISNDVTTSGGDHINQYTYANLSEARKAKVDLEQRAYDEFYETVTGSDSALEIGGLKIQKAWLSFRNIAGVMDARLDFSGVTLYSGAMVQSPKASQDDSGAGLRLSLAQGLAPGLSVALSANAAGGVESEAEDYDTYTLDYYPGEPAWIGAKLAASYDFSAIIGHDLRLSLESVFPDVVERPRTVAASLAAIYDIAGPLSIKARAEADALLWDERDVDDESVFAAAAGLDAEASYLGAGVSARAAWKMAGYGGWNGNDDDDFFYADDLWSDFESAKLGDAIAGEIGLFFQPAAYLGLDLGRLELGGRALFYGPDAMSLLGTGFYGNLQLRLKDVTGLPVTATLGASKWTNPGLKAYSDQTSWPVTTMLSDITYTAAVAWEPSDRVRLSLEVESAPCESKYASYGILSIATYATIQF